MRELTTAEAAERLGVTPQALHKWIQQGHFPNAYKLNPHAKNSPLRIPETDIIAFEKERERQAAASSSLPEDTTT